MKKMNNDCNQRNVYTEMNSGFLDECRRGVVWLNIEVTSTWEISKHALMEEFKKASEVKK